MAAVAPQFDSPYDLPFDWPTTELQRVPMSFDDWLGLPEEVRAEWVDGVALVSPAASLRHQLIAGDLREMLKYALPDLKVAQEGAAKTRDAAYRIPDVIALREYPTETTWLTDAAVVGIEVLSPSTKREDTLHKSGEYLASGMLQYWVVDPDERQLTVLEADGAAWRTVLELDDDHPTGTVVVGEYGEVDIDLPTLIDQ